MRKKALLAGLLAISGIAYAECVPHICQDVYVERLYPNSNGIIYVATSGNENNLDCNPVSGGYVSFNLSVASGNVFYSTLLAAQLADRKVSIRIQNGSEGCVIQYVTHDRQQ